MNDKVDFSGFDLDNLDTDSIEIQDEKSSKGKKKPVKKKVLKKELPPDALMKRAKMNRIKAWLVISSIMIGMVIISGAGIYASLNERPLTQIRSYINQANSQTAFNEAGALNYLEVSFPKFLSSKSNPTGGYQKVSTSEYQITRIVKITDSLALIDFVVTMRSNPSADPENESNVKPETVSRTAWSVILNDEGKNGYSVADDYRNIPIPELAVKARATDLMSFKDLGVVDPEDIKAVTAFLEVFMSNYFQNNEQAVNSFYSNPNEPLVFNNIGEFNRIINLSMYKSSNELGYNARLDYEVTIEGNVIRTSKYFLITLDPIVVNRVL